MVLMRSAPINLFDGKVSCKQGERARSRNGENRDPDKRGLSSPAKVGNMKIRIEREDSGLPRL